jgi:hypothetical protein
MFLGNCVNNITVVSEKLALRFVVIVEGFSATSSQ